MRKNIVMIFLMLFMVILTGCVNPDYHNTNNTGPEGDESLVTQSYDGKTAIITEDTEISNGYVLPQDYETGVSPLTGFQLHKNDIVLVIEEDDTSCRIMLPHGDAQLIRGKVDKTAISYDTSLFEKANQANLHDVTVYDGINGNKIGQKNQPGFIDERKDGWALISFPGGEVFWVKESDLSFNFDMQVDDLPEPPRFPENDTDEPDNMIKPDI